MDHESAQLNLPLWAANALEDDERSQLAEHVAHCEACQRDLESYRALLSTLTIEAPPPDWTDHGPMRQAFAERLKADTPRDAVSAAPPVALPSRTSSSRQAWQRALPWVAAVVVALGGWATAYQFHQASVQSQQVLDLMASGSHVALSASGSPYRAVLSVHQATAVVWAESLPALPPGHLYEGWWIIGGRPVRAGMFSRTPQVLKVPIAQHPAEFAVTIEPARGTKTPTTPVLVAGVLPV